MSAKSERRQNGKVPVRLSEAPHSRVAFVAIWTIIRPFIAVVVVVSTVVKCVSLAPSTIVGR